MDVASRMVRLASGPMAGVAEYGTPDGTPLLALHGAPASRIMFDWCGHAAGERGLRIIAPDRPGYGLSAPLRRGATSLDDQAQWLEELADALGIARFAVLAYSGGAPYATALAARAGARVTALALISPMGPVADLVAAQGAARGGIAFMHRRFFLHLPRRRFFPPLARLGRRLFLASPKGTGGLLPRLAGDGDAAMLREDGVRSAMLAMTREALRQGAEGGISDLQVYGAPWRVDYARIKAQALVWQGTADRIVPVAAARYLAGRIPGCRLIEIERAGHFWFLDHVEEVLDRIVEIDGATRERGVV